METAEVDPTQVLRMTISDLLRQQQRASEVLKKIGLPVRNNEDKTLMEVCMEKQLI